MSLEALRAYAAAPMAERCRMIKEAYDDQARAEANRRAQVDASGYAGCGRGVLRSGWGVQPAILYWNRNW